MNKLTQIGLFIIGLALFNIGCASLTGYQDGKTIGKDNGEVMASLNYSQSPDLVNLNDNKDSFGVNLPYLSFPNIEISGRYGVLENLDISMKVNTNINLSVGGKYQFIGDKSSEYALAAGLDIATFGLLGGLWNLQIPVYGSYHPKNNISLYVSPRYVYQFSQFGGISGWNYLGGNFGVLFGKKNKFGIDFGYYKVGTLSTNSLGMFTFGIGGKFAFGNNFPEYETKY